MELAAALDFVRPRRHGVLVTLRFGGRPQLSNIVFVLGDDGIVRISVTDSRAKTQNLRRDPRASLYVVGDDFWSYLVLDGDAELTPVAAASARRGRSTSSSSSTGPWAASTLTGTSTAQAMVDDGRLVVRLRPERAYGLVQPPG